jgi:hypothetical protein
VSPPGGRVTRRTVFDVDLQPIQSPDQAEVAAARLQAVEREFMVTADPEVLLDLAREVIALRAMLGAYAIRSPA